MMRMVSMFIMSATGFSQVAYCGEPCEPTEVGMIHLIDGVTVDVAYNGMVGLVASQNGQIGVFRLDQGQIDMVGSIERAVVKEMSFVGDYLFALYEGATSIEVLSFKDLGAPTQSAVIELGVEVFDFEIDSDVLYIAAGANGAMSYDISDPSSPTHAGVVTSNDVNHVSAYQSVVLVDEMIDGSRLSQAYDYTDPEDPVLLDGSFWLGLGSHVVHGGFVQPFASGFCVTRPDFNPGDCLNSASMSGFEKHGDEFWVVVSNRPSQSPLIVSTAGYRLNSSSGNYEYQGGVDLASGFGTNAHLAIHGDNVFVAGDGICLTNLSGAVLDYQPKAVTHIEAYQDTVLLGDRNGVVSYDVADPMRPVREGVVYRAADPGQQVGDIEHGDGFIAIAGSYDTGIGTNRLFHLFDDENFGSVGFPQISFDFSSTQSRSIMVDGNRFLFVNGSLPGFFAFDQAGSHLALGLTGLVPFTHEGDMLGDRLVTLSLSGVIEVFDLSTPSAIASLGSPFNSAVGQGKIQLLSESHAVVSNSSSIQILDITDPSAIAVIETISYPGGTLNAVSLKDEELHVSSSGAGLNLYQVFNLVDPGSPTLVSERETLHRTSRLAATGQLAFLAQLDYGISVLQSCASSVCVADLDGNGELDFEDVSAFITAYNEMNPLADFNSDSLFNFYDVSGFVMSYLDGCP
jgi:hypothetical protein